MNTARRLGLLCVVLLLLPLVACGVEPDTAPIPAFPGVEEASGTDSFVVGIMEGVADQLQQQEELDAETNYYLLPADATFADVEQFYDEELSGRDWTKLDEEPELQGGGIAGWERGRNQAFFVMVMPDELSGQTIMMTMSAQR